MAVVPNACGLSQAHAASSSYSVSSLRALLICWYTSVVLHPSWCSGFHITQLQIRFCSRCTSCSLCSRLISVLLAETRVEDKTSTCRGKSCTGPNFLVMSSRTVGHCHVFAGAGMPVVSRSVGMSVDGLPASGARVAGGAFGGRAAAGAAGGGVAWKIGVKTDWSRGVRLAFGFRGLRSGAVVSLPAELDPGVGAMSGSRFGVRYVLSRLACW